MIPYDVIVVGGGHAGCEAALAAARMGARTALMAADRLAIARMSCNPSIGGIAKSHIVFEIDALGGEMACNTDYTGIQFRTLNTKKGPAVQAHRAQCDKHLYPTRMQRVIALTPGLDVLEAMVGAIWVESGKLRGVTAADGSCIPGSTVVITAGTFMRGKIHIGDESFPGGRIGEMAAYELSGSLETLGFRLGRLKTGTPPRLHRDSLDYSKMEVQPGLEPPPLFSWIARRDYAMFHVEQSQNSQEELSPLHPPPLLRSEATQGKPSTLHHSPMFHVEHSDPSLRPWPPGSDQVNCWLTHTTARTHEIIAQNLNRSALYGGRITGTGVRYCPSIEDKIVKFADKESHHVFIEPEGRDNELIYPNGISNSLPRDVQIELVHSIPGLENAEIMNYAYAIEYDFSDPTQLFHSLESKRVEGLFFAGQVNGTTGYEEAAGQGFMAGVNAALKSRSEAPFVLSRHESYTGVLIDDLVTKGTEEPYRMFTSRAEHRLILRQDNARFRMLPHARRLGIMAPEALRETERFIVEIDQESERLRKVFVDGSSLFKMLSRPGISYKDLPGGRKDLAQEVLDQIDISSKYEGYISREHSKIQSAESLELQKIPAWMDYTKIATMRFESREKLARIQPETLGQASRISGINPADIAILAVIIKRGRMP